MNAIKKLVFSKTHLGLRSISIYFLLLIGWLGVAGCGVKGRPQVPEHPPFIGKGLMETTNSEDRLKSPTVETTPPLPPVVTPPPSPEVVKEPTPIPSAAPGKPKNEATKKSKSKKSQ